MTAENIILTATNELLAEQAEATDETATDLSTLAKASTALSNAWTQGTPQDPAAAQLYSSILQYKEQLENEISQGKVQKSTMKALSSAISQYENKYGPSTQPTSQGVLNTLAQGDALLSSEGKVDSGIAKTATQDGQILQSETAQVNAQSTADENPLKNAVGVEQTFIQNEATQGVQNANGAATTYAQLLSALNSTQQQSI